MKNKYTAHNVAISLTKDLYEWIKNSKDSVQGETMGMFIKNVLLEEKARREFKRMNEVE